jgi:hypothetical protein
MALFGCGIGLNLRPSGYESDSVGQFPSCARLNVNSPLDLTFYWGILLISRTERIGTKRRPMASPGELCNKMADVLGTQRSGVVTIWRSLREKDAGVTTGPRGRNAPNCTPRDAADLLIAATAKIPLKSSFESWKRYSALKGRPAHRVPDAAKKALPAELADLQRGHSLRDALTALFASSVSGSLQSFLTDKVNPDDQALLGHVQVRFFSPYPQAFIRVFKHGEKRSVGFEFEYSDRPDGDLTPELLDRIETHFASLPEDEQGDLRQMSEISDRTIKVLGEALRVAGVAND